MKTSKEFFERLVNDEAFAAQVEEAIKAKREAGAANYYETIIPTANELGYEVSEEELDALNKQAELEMSEEELGKVSGGLSCLALTAALVISSIISVGISLPVVTITIKENQ